MVVGSGPSLERPKSPSFTWMSSECRCWTRMLLGLMSKCRIGGSVSEWPPSEPKVSIVPCYSRKIIKTGGRVGLALTAQRRRKAWCRQV